MLQRLHITNSPPPILDRCMSTLAFVTSDSSLPNDYDMPLLLVACQLRGIAVDVCAWDDPAIDWSGYSAVVLRSPWDYIERLPEFLGWCERITAVTDLFNPLSVIRWSLDKHYLADLAAHCVPVVPSRFVEPGTMPLPALREFLAGHPQADDFVIKPTIGCYSKSVRRYSREQDSGATEHIARLLEEGHSAILQPYLPSIDHDGETNLIYFDGVYSHAIRKGALLMRDGTVNAPTYEFRTARNADDDERAVALAALDATATHFGLDRPLLYARVDLIRGNNGNPQLLELEIAEPSLSLPVAKAGAMRFAEALARVMKTKQGT
jgi:glutathione synthase/RimK-type ligase-like ATP-grasp enzyme